MSDTAPKIDPEVLDGTRRAMRQHGWKGTTADRIATEAGISRVTLHRRGIKREHILTALTEIAVNAYREAMWPPLVGDGTGAKRLKQGLSALCEVAEEHLEVLTALSVASDEIFMNPRREAPRSKRERRSPNRSSDCYPTESETAPSEISLIHAKPRLSCSMPSDRPTFTCAPATTGRPRRRET